jgi:hypothetical protein
MTLVVPGRLANAASGVEIMVLSAAVQDVEIRCDGRVKTPPLVLLRPPLAESKSTLALRPAVLPGIRYLAPSERARRTSLRTPPR